MIKAIFFDIDGTLISTNGKILASTKRAIAQAQKKGILCGISTGRGPESVERIVRDLNLDMLLRIMVKWFIQKNKRFMLVRLKKRY